MTSDFALAACAEMIFLESPMTERVRRIDDLGFRWRSGIGPDMTLMIALLREEHIDVVSVALPNFLHLSVLTKVLASGKPVFRREAHRAYGRGGLPVAAPYSTSARTPSTPFSMWLDRSLGSPLPTCAP